MKYWISEDEINSSFEDRVMTTELPKKTHDFLAGFHHIFNFPFTIRMFPKIGGKPPKWMVKIMENPIKMDDLGVSLFLETPINRRISVFGKNFYCNLWCKVRFAIVTSRSRFYDFYA